MLEIIDSFISKGIIGIILLAIFAIGAIFVGLGRKTFMQLWDLILFIVLFVVSYFVLMPLLGDWICDKFMLQFGLDTTVVVSGIEVYDINTFSDLIGFLCSLTEDARFTAEYAYNLAHAITYALALATLSLGILIICPVISSMTWPLIKLALPKKANVFDYRFVGPIVSVLQVFFVFIVIINCFGAYSEGMAWFLKNPEVLSRLNFDAKIFTILKYFTNDLFGPLKVLNFGMLKFQFAANGTVYNAAVEFAHIAKVVAPEGADVDALAAQYGARLLELWMAQYGISLPPSSAIKNFLIVR